MRDDFRPGDLVEVVNIEPCAPQFLPVPLSLGQMVTVSVVIPGRYFGDGVAAIQTREVAHFPPSVGFQAWRFRKIYRPDPKLIERLQAEPVIMPPSHKPARQDA